MPSAGTMNTRSLSDVGVETLASNDADTVSNRKPDPVRSRSSPSQDAPSKPGRSNSVTQQQQATEIVKALFGDVGKVVGIFSCSVARQSGRLYVSAEGLFFYSNLFGFEKKICIRYEDVVELITYRSTSLYVKTLSDDEHVLKSFSDRESVYSLICGYCPCTQIDTVNEQLTTTESNKEEARDTDLACGDSRLRTASETSVRTSDSETENAAEVQSDLPVDNDAIWEAIKRLSSDWDSSVTNMKLSLTKASDFFDLFLADDAPNSLSSYHQRMMKDKNVTIDKWSRDDANASAANSDESFSRTIRFEHKSKVSVAQVTRNQTYRVYGDCACMKNVTHITGVPSSDCFFVEDFWTIEQEGNGIVLNVRFRITFSKNTFLKSIIESRTRSETIEWYSKYASFLKHVIAGKSKENAVEKSPSVNIIPETTCIPYEQRSVLMVVAFSFFATAIYVYCLRTRVTELEHILIELQSRMLEVENKCLLGGP